MAVFVELTTDAFANNFNKSSSSAKAARRAGTSQARRPLRGLEVKDDTYAVLKVVQADGTELPLLDSGSFSGTSTSYTNFILQSVREARMEKHQIVETFGEPYIFFFGESPRFLDVTAVLVDSLDFNWYAEWWENYDRYLRGTKSVEMGARTYLFYDDNIVEGYMLMAQTGKSAEQPLQASLTFRLYLTNYSNITITGGASADPRFPTRPAYPPVTIPSDGTPANSVDPFSPPATGFIAQNVDEFTGAEPEELPPLPPSDQQDQEQDTAGQPDAADLGQTAVQQLSAYGANINNPRAFGLLGMGPYFSTATGFGVFGAVGAVASFGVLGVSSFGSGYRGGINGGIGFTGVFTQQTVAAAPVASVSPFAGQTPVFGVPGQQPFFGFPGPQPVLGVPGQPFFGIPGQTPLFATGFPGQQPQIYGNGVIVQGGVVSGTGIGGGIPLGMSGGIGPNGPGTLPQFTGGSSYAYPNGYNSSAGYGGGVSAYGAAISVGGAPSAFSTYVAPGSLVAAGTVQSGFFIGPGGVSSYTNTTGVFV
jgi:hypothetical protein